MKISFIVAVYHNDGLAAPCMAVLDLCTGCPSRIREILP